MRGLSFAIATVIIMVGSAFPPAPAWGASWGTVIINTRPYLPKKDVTVPKDKFYVWCYSMWTGAPIECEIQLQLRKKDWSDGVDDPAGHTQDHAASQPVGNLRRINSGEQGVYLDFNTNGEVVYIQYLIPEVSGEYVLDYWYKMWWMESSVFMPSVREYRVKVPYLEELEPSPDGIYKLTGTESDVGKRHMKNHFLTSVNSEKIKETADFYYDFGDGNVIQFNDMSLPWGGMFDMNGDWNVKSGHVTHRTGTDVDVDRWVNGKEINCDADYTLKKAMRHVRITYNVNNKGFPKLECESGGRKHIDFD